MQFCLHQAQLPLNLSNYFEMIAFFVNVLLLLSISLTK